MNPKKILFLITIALIGLCTTGQLPGSNSTHRVSAASQTPTGAILIIPDQMTLVGDVSTQTNTIGQCTQTWMNGTPAGTIILGVKPTSCNPSAWVGATATASVYLPAVGSGATIYNLKISWPDRDGKGLHSPLKNRKASILWDGQPIWDMRTVETGSYGDYYANEHFPILTSIVVTQSLTHTLTISVPAQTAWDISQIELNVRTTPQIIRGIAYSPYRDCQYASGPQPTIAQIDEDLRRLVHTSNAIRTYAVSGVHGLIPSHAKALGLLTFPGAWLDKNTADDAEIEALINIANTQSVDGVIVGNEFYLRHDAQVDLDYLLQRIQQVRSQIPVHTPLITAEIDSMMFFWPSASATTPIGINPAYRPILDNSDYVLVHIYPFWSGLTIEGAANFTVQRYLAIKTLLAQEYPGQNKRLIIGEAGWPSGGGKNGSAVPSMQNAHRYYLEFLQLADQYGVEYFYFDAFDELWKIEGPGVGQHWGYNYSDRSAKYAETGLFLTGTALADRTLTLTSESQNAEPISDSPDAQITTIFTVFNEWPEGPKHFVPSGRIGDTDHLDMYGCDREQPFDGEMATRVSFIPGGTLGWSGVYWRYPENNVGNLKDGINLSQANELTFWARGQQGGERIRFIVGGIGTQTDLYPDSLRPAVSTGFVRLNTEWQQFTINLRDKDLAHIIGGFGWVTDQCANSNGAVFYLDKIEFNYNPNPPPQSRPHTTLPVYTDAAQTNNHFTPSGFMDAAADPANIKLSECWAENPHSGLTSIRIQYTHNPSPGQYGGGIYWLDPAENWGDRPGGIDLRDAVRLTFWARSEISATINVFLGGVGYRNWNGNSLCDQPINMYPDSLCPKIETSIQLTPNWQKYTINLKDYPRDYQRVVGGFGWYAAQTVTFYLDDIQYEYDRVEFFLPSILR